MFKKIIELLKRKYSEDINLDEINDEFENKCREQLFKRFLENS